MTPYEIATEVAEELQGSCKFLSTALEERGAEGMDNNAEFCARLDELVFCCIRCDWWCEQSEMAENPADEWICQECFDEE